MIGFSANSNSITGVSNANINVIESQSITSSTYNGIPAQNILYLASLSSNVQQQINNITYSISNGGGGSFLVYGESSVGFDPTNNNGRHWVHGSGVVGYVGITVPTSILIGISVQALSYPTTAATVVIEKNVGDNMKMHL